LFEVDPTTKPPAPPEHSFPGKIGKYFPNKSRYYFPLGVRRHEVNDLPHRATAISCAAQEDLGAKTPTY
jgi:hypothetical protein